MRETTVALAIALLLAGLAWLLTMPSEALMLDGSAIMLGAAAIALPLEVYYFTALGVALARRGVLPKGWYWRSFDHHHLLSRREGWIVLPAFYSGALALVVCMLGIGVTVTGLVGALLSL